MRVCVALIPGALAGTLAACAAPPPKPPPPKPPSTSTTAGEGMDGVYRPPPDGAHGNRACGNRRFRSPIRVVNGVASFQTKDSGLLQGQVAPDGSLLIEHGRGTLRGQFTDRTFNGNYRSGRCFLRLTYSK